MKIAGLAVCYVLCAGVIHAAEYKGRKIDGETFSASAFSYSTSKYYDVDVVFDGTDVTLTFTNGKTITIDIDDEEIDDPSNISAFDYKTSTFWDLDVSDLEGDTSALPRGPRKRPSHKPLPSRKLAHPASPSAQSQDIKVEIGDPSELGHIDRLCVAGPTEAAKALRTSLVPLVEGLVPLADEDCAKTATAVFIYNETDRLGVVALFNPKTSRARVIFRENGSSLEVVSKLVAQLRKTRQAPK